MDKILGWRLKVIETFSWAAGAVVSRSKVVDVVAILMGAGTLAALSHIFFGFADSAPYLAVDEALVNVVYNTTEFSRYGYTFQPLQAAHLVLRSDWFFNHGPWYYWFGAAVDWLFGHSLVLQRAIHPLTVLMISIAGYFAFRKHMAGAFALLAAVLSILFVHLEWPMFRPDSFVGLWAILAILPATKAYRTGNNKAWALSAFCVTNAFVTHQIAWSLIPAMALFWGIWLIDKYEETRRWEWSRLQPAFSMFGGGLVSLFLYAAGIGFRVIDLVKLWTKYWGNANDPTPRTTAENLEMHFNMAWGGLGPLDFIVFVVFGAAIAVLAVGIFLRLEQRREIFSYILPPLIIGLGYQVSLANFPNPYGGYAIIVHFTTAWLGVATMVMVPELIPGGYIYFKKALKTSLTAASTIVAVITIFMLLTRPGNWENYADTAVGIESYINKVIEPLPEGSSSWATSLFGIVPPKRLETVIYGAGILLLQEFAQEDRKKLAPDSFILGQYAIGGHSFHFVRNGESRIGKDWTSEVGTLRLNGMAIWGFPDRLKIPYQLIGIVTAPPYGATRVYAPGVGSVETAANPYIAINDGVDGAWTQRLGQFVEAKSYDVDPVVFDLAYSLWETKRPADRSIAVDLPAGDYLVGLKLVRPIGEKAAGVIFATQTTSYSEFTNELGFRIPTAPYFDFETVVSVLVIHDGGPLYLSHFTANPKVDIELAFIRKIGNEKKDSGLPKVNLEIPDISEWEITALDGRISESLGLGRRRLFGDDTRYRYQIMSPSIALSSNSVFDYIPDIEVEEGKIAVGILNDRGNWLVQPRPPGQLIKSSTGGTKSIRIVISNNNSGSLPVDQRSRFVFSKGALGLVRLPVKGRYIDDLSACYPGGKRKASIPCRK